MAKYTNARYPDKINDLIDNDGNINPEVVPASVFVWNTEMVEPISDTKFKLYLREEDFFEIAEKQPLKITMNTHVPDKPDDIIEIGLVYKKLINAGVIYNGHGEDGTVYDIEMYYDENNDEYIATLSVNQGDEPGTDKQIDFGFILVGDSKKIQPSPELREIVQEMASTGEERREKVQGVLLVSDGSDIVLHYNVYATIGVFSGEENEVDLTFNSSFGTIDVVIIGREITVDLTNFLNPFSGGSKDQFIDINGYDIPGLLHAVSAIAGISDSYSYDECNGLRYTFYVKNSEDAVFNRNDELFKKLKSISEHLIDIRDNDNQKEARKVWEAKIYYWLGTVPLVITHFRLNNANQNGYTMECDVKYRSNADFEYIGVLDTSILFQRKDGEDTFYSIIIDNTFGIFNLKYITSPE